MNYTYLLIIIVIVLVLIYYIETFTTLFVKIKAYFINDPNQDCLFTQYSKCKNGKQTRDIIVHNKGKGNTCEPVVRDCKDTATKNTWESCENSEQCIGADKYCHVGDMRCMTKMDCDWANSVDGTSRNCAVI
jgi:hypothetical protein